MRYTKYFIIPLLLLSFGSLTVKAANPEDNTQMVIHLLDYISRDYAAAVKNGEIINPEEYAEMLEFSNTVYGLAEPILKKYPQQNKVILPKMELLKVLVRQKAETNKIAELAREIRSEIILLTGYQVSPLQWPDIPRGKALYTQLCVACHGVKGDGQGKLASTLNPFPTNFLDDTLMQQVSPFQTFNTIRLGIGGTAMRAYTELSDEETWDLAFYVKSLRFEAGEVDSTKHKQPAGQALEKVGLAEVATLSDQELLKRLGDEKKEARERLVSLRLHRPDPNSLGSLQVARQNLRESLKAYRQGSVELARQKALAAYLEGIEPIEARLKTIDQAFTVALEQQMMTLRSAIENNEPASVIQEEVENSLAMVSEAAEILGDEDLSFWLSFLLSASILLREGLEAFLIIAVILAVLRSTGAKKALPWIHGGWIGAILVGIVGWFFSGWLLKISGADREIMEGVVALFAVAVLTYVGFWLHDKSHTAKWKAFVETRIQNLLRTGNMLGLSFFSFIVVFRETFESVLFLQAIKLQTAEQDQASIGFGAGAAFLIIGVFAVLFMKYTKRLPITQLFRYSSWMITLLALVLMGKGVHAIQEAGTFTVTHFPLFRIEWLGIYPTVESVLAQTVLLVLILGLWYYNKRRIRLSS